MLLFCLKQVTISHIFIMNFHILLYLQVYNVFLYNSSEHKKITDNFLSAIMAPRVGLEPTTYRLLHYINFH